MKNELKQEAFDKRAEWDRKFAENERPSRISSVTLKARLLARIVLGRPRLRHDSPPAILAALVVPGDGDRRRGVLGCAARMDPPEAEAKANFQQGQVFVHGKYPGEDI
jgi:hypothetical protein